MAKERLQKILAAAGVASRRASERLITDGRVLEVSLTDQEREWASVEGWEVLADFDPALFRTGAEKRWHELRQLPIN